MKVFIACLHRLGGLAVCLSLLAGLAVSKAQALETTAEAAILMDAKTGAVLFEKNADKSLPPSSMSKMMTV
ncbi:MAG: D-alanyl-D-alanine carboxypeptidase, partial [Alphaproteobacteria bacterium]